MSLESADNRPERTDYRALRSLKDNSAKTDQQDAASKETTVAVEAKPTNTTEPLLVSHNMTLDRLANIQTYTQVLTKSYELHEYQIPRFFIVLPKSTRGQDTILKPFSDQFRLYFVCECGMHTTDEGSEVVEKVHLSQHRGYDINQPAAFFKKFGLYVLAMMQTIRRASVVEFDFPQLEHLKLMQETDGTQEQLNYTKETFGRLIDETISSIEKKTKPADGGTDLDLGDNIGPQQLREIETLEDVGLVQLGTFLKETDEGQALGNLYRTVTDKGHVKWVCRQHFLTTHRESAWIMLLKFVVANGGEFNETLGSVKISLQDRTQAREFYAALEEAQGVHALAVQLKWSVTMDDLKKLSAAILKSPVIDLRLDGDAFSRSVSDIFNHRRQYDPLLRLLVEGRIQMVKFENFRGFFGHISGSSVDVFQSIPRLRVLDLCLHLDDKHRSQILGFVKKCTGLRRLRMRSNEKMDDPTIACARACPSLEELEILCGSTITIIHLMDTIVPEKMRRDDHLVNLRSLLIDKPGCSVLTTFSKDGMPVVTITSEDGHSWPTIIEKYGWAMKETSAPTVSVAGMAGGHVRIALD